MFLVQVIKQSSCYLNEFDIEINKSFTFESKREANKKVKELIKKLNMKKIGYTFMNNLNQEISTNY